MAHVEVWYDKTSDYNNPVWVVSLENGSSDTISVHRTKKAALKRGRSEARKRGLSVRTNPKKQRARKLMRSASKKLAAWVRSQAKANRPKRQRLAGGRKKATRSMMGEFTDAEFRQHLRSHSGGKRSRSRKTHEFKGNPRRVALKLPRTGHTGMMGAKGVDIVTKGGRIVEVKVKR